MIRKKLSRKERLLWGGSLLVLTVVFFFFFSRSTRMAWAASLAGASALIFCARAEPVGQALMIGFSILYGILSFRCAYYGEMITYLGMSGPMAALSMVSWLRHPFEKGKSQVQIERLSLNKIVCLFFFSLLVTGIFYVVLKELNTVHLKWSTISVFTSFAAVLLTFWRSSYYALGYAANDLVLIVLWTLQHDIVMILCFAVFLINDLCGFCNWRKMEKYNRRDKDVQRNAKKKTTAQRKRMPAYPGVPQCRCACLVRR